MESALRPPPTHAIPPHETQSCSTARNCLSKTANYTAISGFVLSCLVFNSYFMLDIGLPTAAIVALGFESLVTLLATRIPTLIEGPEQEYLKQLEPNERKILKQSRMLQEIIKDILIQSELNKFKGIYDNQDRITYVRHPALEQHQTNLLMKYFRPKYAVEFITDQQENLSAKSDTLLNYGTLELNLEIQQTKPRLISSARKVFENGIFLWAPSILCFFSILITVFGLAQRKFSLKLGTNDQYRQWQFPVTAAIGCFLAFCKTYFNYFFKQRRAIENYHIHEYTRTYLSSNSNPDYCTAYSKAAIPNAISLLIAFIQNFFFYNASQKLVRELLALPGHNGTTNDFNTTFSTNNLTAPNSTAYPSHAAEMSADFTMIPATLCGIIGMLTVAYTQGTAYNSLFFRNSSTAPREQEKIPTSLNLFLRLAYLADTVTQVINQQRAIINSMLKIAMLVTSTVISPSAEDSPAYLAPAWALAVLFGMTAFAWTQWNGDKKIKFVHEKFKQLPCYPRDLNNGAYIPLAADREQQPQVEQPQEGPLRI